MSNGLAASATPEPMPTRAPFWRDSQWRAQSRQRWIGPSPLRQGWRVGLPTLMWGVWIAALLWVLATGLAMRFSFWPDSAPARFPSDIANGWQQGAAVWHVARLAQRQELNPPNTPLPPTLPWHDFFTAYLHDYDRQVALHPDGHYELDYPPLRLMIMSLWVKHERQTHPKTHDWKESPDWLDEAAWPLIHLNTVSDTAAMLLTVALVWYWLRRQQNGQRLEAGRPIGGWGASPYLPRRLPQWPEFGALLAGALLYFNLPLILDGHGWPQWDGWVLPFTLAAMLLLSLGCGFSAGVALVIGIMAKGQMGLVLPVFIVWPLAQGQWRVLIRLLGGICFTLAALTSPWLLAWPGSHGWVICVALATVLAMASPWRWLREVDYRWAIITIALLIVLVAWPWSPLAWLVTAAVVSAVVLGSRGTRELGVGYALGLLGLAVLVAGINFEGDWNWYQVGFASAAERYQAMEMGPTSNLCALLGNVFEWHMHDTVTTVGTSWHVLGYHLSILQTLDLELTLNLIYAATVVACGIGAAAHARKNDARVLVSLTAPWAAFYCLMPMMHERYLMWIAALSAVAVPLGGGFFVLYLLFSLVSSSLIVDQLAGANIQYVSANLKVLQQIRPGSAYITVLLLAFYVYAGIFPRWSYQPIPRARQMLSLNWLRRERWRGWLRKSYRAGDGAGVRYGVSPTA